MKNSAMLAILFAGMMTLAAPASARPISYTLKTVTDGQLGALSFTRADVVITFTGDTRNVQTTTLNGSSIYTLKQGSATVSVTVAGKTTQASFARNQIFVRYDEGQGIVGFGSAISDFYPVSIGCGAGDCSIGAAAANLGGSLRYGTAPALADVLLQPADVVYVSAPLLALPQNLTAPTLQTGNAFVCAGSYGPTFYTDIGDPCTVAASVGLKTSLGMLKLQDNNVANVLLNGYEQYEVAFFHSEYLGD